ncbi:unnamed protein product [Protopolystoma xenopodis]|uniref:Major facilitator superfamily (MFS) profile domain-containing protein n=1 Tax=Protopolystoma xenopodis TaxID=117903 RepID=A0A448XFL8_9PLAT|nr:unnamed protein product [Protopolystoma xenopodis]
MLPFADRELQVSRRDRMSSRSAQPSGDTGPAEEHVAARPAWLQRYRRLVGSPKFWISFSAATWGFLTSVERSVILSTLFLYFKTYWNAEAAQNFYGATMSAFSLAILIMTPVFGLLAHAGLRVKVILLLSDQLEIVGNLLYLIGTSPWLVLLGRFISGAGASCEPPLYADIARVTSLEERTPIIVTILVSRQCGLMFGPAFTLILHNMNVTIAGFSLSVYNGPGLLMAGLWILHTLVVLLTYPNIDDVGRVIDSSLNKLTSRDLQNCCSCYQTCPQAAGSSSYNETGSLQLSDCAEDTHLIPPSDETTGGQSNYCRCGLASLRPYSAYNLVTMYAVSFAVYFCFMSLEAVLPPVANRYFDWNEVEVSYVYLGAGGLVLVFCAVLHFLTQCCSDRSLVLAGCATLVVSYIWLAVCCATLTTAPLSTAIPLTMIGIAIHVAGMPLATACSESLYSKLVKVVDMNRAQAILRTVINVAFLLGPFFGGTLHYIALWVFTVMAIMMSIPVLLLALRFNDFLVVPVSPTSSASSFPRDPEHSDAEIGSENPP